MFSFKFPGKEEKKLSAKVINSSLQVMCFWGMRDSTQSHHRFHLGWQWLRYHLFLASLWLVMAEIDSDDGVFKCLYLQAVGGKRRRWENLHDDHYPSFPLWLDDMRLTLPQKASSHSCAVCVLSPFFYKFHMGKFSQEKKEKRSR